MSFQSPSCSSNSRDRRPVCQHKFVSSIGYTSLHGLEWYRWELRDLKPDIASVYFGWNDLWREKDSASRAWFRRRVEAESVPVRKHLWNATLRQRYNEIVAEVARESGATLADSARKLRASGGRKLFERPDEDPIHPNELSYRIISAVLTNAVSEAVRGDPRPPTERKRP